MDRRQLLIGVSGCGLGVLGVHAASDNERGNPWKPDWSGCTINGKLKITEATTSPAKLKASLMPMKDSTKWPKPPCGLNSSSR